MDSTRQVKELLATLKKDFAEWNHNPQLIRLHHQEPIAELEKYVTFHPDFVAVQVEVKSFHTWHLTLFEGTALNNKGMDTENLALAAKYAAWLVLLEEPLARIHRGGPLLKDKAAFYLALQIICGWKRYTVAVGDALREGLDHDLLDLRVNDRHDAGKLFPHFWFLMHLYADLRGHKPIDVSLYSYPDSMAPYEQVLADWRTTDLAKVKRWVEEMAEHHVQMSDNSNPEAVNEFDYDDYQLFPYEILAFLRAREWAGLANPTQFDHPLMQQPLATLPAPVPLPEPGTPLLDKVLARYRREYPDLRWPEGV